MATVQKSKVNVATKKKESTATTLFTKENYKLMMIAGGVLLLGFLLMLGGASKDPNAFDKNQVYSFVRVTIAPLLVLVGLATFVYAIMKTPKDLVTSVEDLLKENKPEESAPAINVK